ncbi:MAG: hypothetical protein U9R38_04025 [Candidatus Margulisiibacteriota bacterium]|nr:hypothetical protein [Candidatus Margulisiibacteriota bacterium]
MRKEKDFEEFLGLLNKHKVKYCIVGAYAVGLHAEPRYTKDLDILIEPTKENGRKIVKALKDFGFESMNLSASDFIKQREVIQLGVAPVRIDLITSIKGCSFKEVWKNKISDEYGKNKVCVIGLDELIKAKKASNRSMDKADLELLSIAKKRKKKNER